MNEYEDNYQQIYTEAEEMNTLVEELIKLKQPITEVIAHMIYLKMYIYDKH